MNPYETPLPDEATNKIHRPTVPTRSFLNRCSSIGSLMFLLSIPAMIGLLLLHTILGDRLPLAVYFDLGCSIAVLFVGGLLIFAISAVLQAVMRKFR